MYNVSQSYLDALASKAVSEAVTGRLTLPNSGVINISDANLVSGSLKLTKELCGEKYRIGTFNLSCLKFSFFADDAISLDLTGGTASLSYKLGAAGESLETVPLGTFLVDPILSSRRKDVVTIVAYDAGIKADKEPSDNLRNMTGTPAQLIIAACSECGIDTDIAADSFVSFPNSTITVSPKDRQIQSCRDIIMWCAYLLCGYAVINRASKLEVISAKYTVTAGGTSISTDREVSANERKYIYATDTRAYIKYMSGYKENDVVNYTSSYVSTDEQAAPAAYALDKNPLLAGKTAAEYDAANRAWLGYIDSFKQRGIKTCIYGDPAIDTGDTLIFRGGDVDQRDGIIGVVTSYEWIYRVGHYINCSAADCTGSLVGGQAVTSTQTRSQTQKRIDAVEGGSGSGGSGVGEDVGHHSERFNGYETADGNTITVTDLNPNTDREYNHAECYKNTMLNCRASHATGAQNSLTSATNTIIGGYNNTVTGGVNNLIIGQNHTINNTGSSNRDSVIAGNLQGVSGAVASVVAGCLHTGTPTNSVIAGMEHILSPNNYCVTAGIGSVPASPLGNMICFIAANTTLTGNTFLVDIAGNVFAYTYNTYGADYAEFFEWADGNPENEDRRGMLVSLDGEKIIPADGDDIIGIVSANPSVIGDSASFGWQGKFKRDVFGSVICGEDKKPLISEEYDPNAEYRPRAVRSEWAAVGLVGKLIITDDGTCKVGGYVSARNGIGTACRKKTGIRVLKRVDKTHVEVLIK